MALNNIGLGFLFTAKDLASGTMRKLEGNFKSLDNTTEQTQKTFKTNTQKMATGLGLMAAGAIGLRVLGPAVTEARSFGKAIGEVSTLVDEATFSTEQMRDITMGMAETFGISALKQAPALYQTISAGISDAGEATKLLEIANKLAIGGVTDLTTSVDGLTTAVNAYASSNLTAEDAADAMFVAIKAGKTTAEELSRTLGRVAPIAESLGVGFDELSAGLAAITTKGIATSEAVSGLKAAFANVLKPTKEAKDEAKRLGIQFNATSLRSKGLKGFLDSVTNSAKFNSDSMAQLFGSVEALNAIIALTSNNGAKFEEVLGLMENKTGAADEAFKKMNATFDAQMNRLSANTGNFKILVGDALLPLISALATVVGGLVKSFNAIPGPVRSVIVIGFTLASVLLFVGGAVFFLKGAFGALGLANIGLVAKLGSFVKVLGALGLSILKLVPLFVTGFLSMAASAFALLIPLLPIILVILAIGAAIALVVIFFDDLVDAAVVAIEFIVNGAKRAARGFAILFKFMVKGWKLMFQIMTAPIRALGRIVQTVTGFIKDAFTAAAEAIISVWSGIVDALTPVFNFITSIIQGISNFIDFILEKINDAIDLAKDAASFVADIGGGVFDFVTETVNPFSDDFLELPSFGGEGSVNTGGGGLISASVAQTQAQTGGRAQPINLTSNTIVDGEIVGTVTKRFLADENTRSFGPSSGEDL